MKRLLIILLFLYVHHSYAQTPRVDAFIVAVEGQSAESRNPVLKFPTLHSGNDLIDSLINHDMKNRFLGDEFAGLSMDSSLILWADEHTFFLGFEVTYLKNNILSLNISAEICAAHCTHWTDYFTYSLTTGKHMEIDEIVDSRGSFVKRVIADRYEQYNKDLAELEKIYQDKQSGLDEDTYKWVLEQQKSCRDSFMLDTFALYADHIEIIEPCTFPHAIQNYAPVTKMKYLYQEFKKEFTINLED